MLGKQDKELRRRSNARREQRRGGNGKALSASLARNAHLLLFPNAEFAGHINNKIPTPGPVKFIARCKMYSKHSILQDFVERVLSMTSHPRVIPGLKNSPQFYPLHSDFYITSSLLLSNRAARCGRYTPFSTVSFMMTAPAPINVFGAIVILSRRVAFTPRKQ